MGYRNQVYKQISKASVVLAMVSVCGSVVPSVFASELGDEQATSQSGGENIVSSESVQKVLLKDQTFTLGRLKLSKGMDYQYMESVPEKGIVDGVVNRQEVREPLGEDFEGYVEVKSRIKVDGEVWLEVEVNGEFAGYITQGSKEVKPLVKTQNVPFIGKDKKVVLGEDRTLYSDISFINTTESQLKAGDEVTVLGLYDVSFYSNPVASYKVKTGDNKVGWVKATDIERIEESKEDANKEDANKEEANKEEATKIKVKSGTVLYNKPTYLEDAEGIETVNVGVNGEVIKELSDEGTRGYYYKVYTEDGKEGYLEASEVVNGKESTEVSSKGISKTVTPKDTVIGQTLSGGLEGARDYNVAYDGETYQATKEVVVKGRDNKEETYYELHTVKSGEAYNVAEGGNADSDDSNYPETFIGYVLSSSVVEDKEETKEDANAKEEDTQTAEEKELSERQKELDNLKKSIKKDIELEQKFGGWEVGGSNSNNNGNNNSNSDDGNGNTATVRYNKPSSATSDTTVRFIEVLAPYADTVRDGGLYPSVMMAQAIIESDNGLSGLAQADNNLFGIKGAYKGNTSVYSTQEVVGGVTFTTESGFRSYPSLQEGIEDYVSVLRGDLYARNGVVNAPSAFHSLMGIKNAGYATDPYYVPKVWSVIDAYDLTQFD